METSRRLNYNILKTTVAIAAIYPELSKYIEEMPVRFSAHDAKITSADLSGYLESLNSFLNRYSKSHPTKGIVTETKLKTSLSF